MRNALKTTNTKARNLVCSQAWR